MAANQSIVYVLDANTVKQAVACVPVTWAGVSNVNMQAMMPIPWNYTTVSVSGVTVVKNTSGVIGAVINLDANNAQTCEIQIFDNATTNSGNKVMDEISLSVKGRYDWQPGGIQLNNGIVVNVIGSITASGLLILWL